MQLRREADSIARRQKPGSPLPVMNVHFATLQADKTAFKLGACLSLTIAAAQSLNVVRLSSGQSGVSQGQSHFLVERLVIKLASLVGEGDM